MMAIKGYSGVLSQIGNYHPGTSSSRIVSVPHHSVRFSIAAWSKRENKGVALNTSLYNQQRKS